MSVLVITPTTGAPELVQAIRSVTSQTYKDIHHLIVVDGYQFSQQTDKTFIEGGIVSGGKITRVDLPFNTGIGGYYGHRVMAGFSHLVNHKYLLFLDQDNFYEPDHISSMVDLIEQNNYDWCYSLRTIVDKSGNFVCKDNCESLGKWPAWVDQNAFLIDSSTYCFKTSFFRQVGYLWDYGWGADRRFYTILKEHLKHEAYGCTGKHSLNYRLGGNEGSVTAEFFEQGNQRMLLKYKSESNFPWLKQSL